MNAPAEGAGRAGIAAGAVHVEVMDPGAVLTLVRHPDVGALAAEVRQRLALALAAV